VTDVDTLFRAEQRQQAEHRYHQLADRILAYYEIDKTIESDVAEFGELRRALRKEAA
jgi:hypothetical protein